MVFGVHNSGLTKTSYGQPNGNTPNKLGGFRTMQNEIKRIVKKNPEEAKLIARAVLNLAQNENGGMTCIAAAKLIDEWLDGPQAKDVRMDVNVVEEATRRQLKEWSRIVVEGEEVEDAEFDEVNGEENGNGTKP